MLKGEGGTGWEEAEWGWGRGQRGAPPLPALVKEHMRRQQFWFIVLLPVWDLGVDAQQAEGRLSPLTSGENHQSFR